MQTAKKSIIRRRVMARVYMSFVLSFLEHRFFWQGFLLGACVALFGRLVHVASVTHNLLSTPVGQVPDYVEGSFMHAFATGEFLTVVVTLGMVVIGLSGARILARLTIAPVFGKMA